MIRSWKTTLTGLLTIVVGALKLAKPHFLNWINDGDYVFAITVLIGILGISAKDSNVTGQSGPDTAAK